MRRAPIGAKRMPTMNIVGSTVRGVRIGCHAFRRCCLNAVSVTVKGKAHSQSSDNTPPSSSHPRSTREAKARQTRTCRSPPAALLLLRPLALRVALLLAVEDRHAGSARCVQQQNENPAQREDEIKLKWPAEEEEERRGGVSEGRRVDVGKAESDVGRRCDDARRSFRRQRAPVLT